MARVENAAEGMGRWILACAIAGTIPLALWGGACGKRPVVEPKLDGGGDDGRGIDRASDLNGDVSPTDRPYAVDLVGADAVGDAPATTFDGPVVPDSASDGTARDLPLIDQVNEQPIDRAIDQVMDRAAQDFPSVPDAAAGCCTATSTNLCSADGSSLFACLSSPNVCGGPTYGWMWVVQACRDGCVTEGPDGPGTDANIEPHCR